MHNYIRYEIVTRLYSSNVIAGVYLHTDENGKVKEKKDLIFTCFLTKSLADPFIQEIFDLHFKNKTNE